MAARATSELSNKNKLPNVYSSNRKEERDPYNFMTPQKQPLRQNLLA